MTYVEKAHLVERGRLGIIPDEQIIPFRERLTAAIGGEGSVRSFAKKCNLSPSTISNYLDGNSYPTLDRLATIARESNSDLAWLVTGESKGELSRSTRYIEENVIVPEYDVQASAGGGSFVGEEVKIGEFSFPETWLRQKKLYGCDLCVISAWGESMEPSIQNKDSLLISLLDKSEIAAYDGVYVLRLDGLLLVKRMQYDMENRGHHIVSDNPIYGSTFIPNIEFDERVAVIGAVAGVVYKQMRPASQPAQNGNKDQ